MNTRATLLLLLNALCPAAGLPAQSPTPTPAAPPAAPMVLTTTPEHYTTVQNAPLRYDTQGRHINLHGGGVMFHEGTYYWYGESRNPRVPGQPGTAGVGCYTSQDLCNWEDRGVVLETIKDDPSSDFTAGCTVERPKVIYNAKTGKFVLWFHLELKDKGYTAARAALAVGDTPLGPFKYVRSGRVNAGIWPVNLPEEYRTPLDDAQWKVEHDRAGARAGEEGLTARRDFNGGQMSRDMTLYVDDDAKAYLVTSAEGNQTLHIHELTDDYQGFTGKFARVAPGGANEAPAMCKHDGKYYLLCSGTSGWDPNAARLLVSEGGIFGPYKNAGNPCVGINPANNLGPNKTFGGQSTFIFPVQGKRDALVAMFDVWRPKVQLLESGHLWLPIGWQGDKMTIRWQTEWDPATAF